MAFQAVPNTAEIVIKYLLHTEEMFNVIHANLVGGYLLSDLQLLADAVDFAVADNWLPLQTQDALYDSVTVRGLAVENDFEAFANTFSASGQIVEVGLPGNVTLSIKKGSGLTGRSARGRLYWIGAPRGALSSNENVFTIARADGFVAGVEAIRSAINATIWRAVIVSRFSGGVKRPEGVVFVWNETSKVDSNVDSARRRLLR